MQPIHLLAPEERRGGAGRGGRKQEPADPPGEPPGTSHKRAQRGTAARHPASWPWDPQRQETSAHRQSLPDRAAVPVHQDLPRCAYRTRHAHGKLEPSDPPGEPPGSRFTRAPRGTGAQNPPGNPFGLCRKTHISLPGEPSGPYRDEGNRSPATHPREPPGIHARANGPLGEPPGPCGDHRSTRTCPEVPSGRVMHMGSWSPATHRESLPDRASRKPRGGTGAQNPPGEPFGLNRVAHLGPPGEPPRAMQCRGKPEPGNPPKRASWDTHESQRPTGRASRTVP